MESSYGAFCHLEHGWQLHWKLLKCWGWWSYFYNEIKYNLIEILDLSKIDKSSKTHWSQASIFPLVTYSHLKAHNKISISIGILVLIIKRNYQKETPQIGTISLKKKKKPKSQLGLSNYKRINYQSVTAMKNKKIRKMILQSRYVKNQRRKVLFHSRQQYVCRNKKKGSPSSVTDKEESSPSRDPCDYWGEGQSILKIKYFLQFFLKFIARVLGKL